MILIVTCLRNMFASSYVVSVRFHTKAAAFKVAKKWTSCQ